jgi:tyrosine-protein phosphatase YwqE
MVHIQTRRPKRSGTKKALMGFLALLCRCMSFFSFFSRSSPVHQDGKWLKVDMHGHFLPGIDDGAVNLEESLRLLENFEERGFEKIIATPHIIQDLYQNTPETIFPVLEMVRTALEEKGSSLQLEAAAEYFIDDHFIEMLEAGEPLLRLFDNYVLVETGFINEPAYLRDVLFKMRLKGYRPVFAHPERYLYLQNKKEKLEELFDSGVFLQINTMSLMGYYGPVAQKYAEWMIEQGFVHFLGSDCHRTRHLEPLKKAISSKGYKKLMDLELMNPSFR